jgi:hypothetical protein
MPNTSNPSGNETPEPGRRPGQSHKKVRQAQGNQDHEPHRESGDREPEDGRNTGLSTGQGETGEDESLSGDAGDDERH